MAYRVADTESPEAALRRILTEEIDAGIGEASDPRLDLDVAVHQLRKRCKRSRGLVALYRASLAERRREDRRFRDIGRRLGGARDAASVLEALDATIAEARESVLVPAVGPVRTALEARREAVVDAAVEGRGQLERCRTELETARPEVPALSIAERGWDAIGPGLEHTYRRGRRKWKRVLREPTIEQLHRWRKHVKYHWYHVRLLQDVDPVVLSERRVEMKELEELLGNAHDLAVVEARVPELDLPPEPRDAALQLVASRRSRLQEAALEIGARVYAEKPRVWTESVALRWREWHRP